MQNYTDYQEKYGRIMQFGKNKKTPIHRWYPFVEGYSREFIKSIIDEQKADPTLCIDPFSGSGTTSLELQRMGIRCYSFEVNPFMYKLSKVKIRNYKYTELTFTEYMNSIRNTLKTKNVDNYESSFRTLVENEENLKWNIDREVFGAIQEIRFAISTIEDSLYSDLFEIALASILLEISNLYRNGKCLSYKHNWETLTFSQNEVFEKYFWILENVFLPDIVNITNSVPVSNDQFLYLGDCRELIDRVIDDDSVDLVITSPPYLNSRDYTDSYMLELKTLGYVTNFEDISDLRKLTFRSHVQVKWQIDKHADNQLVEDMLEKIKMNMTELKQWNKEIPTMISAYFADIEILFAQLYRKLKVGGRIYFNVSNSAYFNVLIDTIEVCSFIAENVGFCVLEIRKARYLSPSAQQKQSIKRLLEGIIVLEKQEK